MKKGKVEWLYKAAALMPDGKIGTDIFTTEKKWTKKEVQEMAESLKTDVYVEYMGTLIRPPEKDNNLMTYNFLTDEERKIRIEYAQREEKQHARNDDKEAVSQVQRPAES